MTGDFQTAAAAIILCAGKGTRMGSANINKVAFDCAGVPVVRRIVENMRQVEFTDDVAGCCDRYERFLCKRVYQ